MKNIKYNFVKCESISDSQKKVMTFTKTADMTFGEIIKWRCSQETPPDWRYYRLSGWSTKFRVTWTEQFMGNFCWKEFPNLKDCESKINKFLRRMSKVHEAAQQIRENRISFFASIA